MRSTILPLPLLLLAGAALAAPPPPEAFPEPPEPIMAPTRTDLTVARNQVDEHFADRPDVKRLWRAVFGWASRHGEHEGNGDYVPLVVAETGSGKKDCGLRASHDWDEVEYRRHAALYEELLDLRMRKDIVNGWIEKIESGTLEKEKAETRAKVKAMRERFTEVHREPGDWLGLKPEKVTRKLSWAKVRENFSFSLAFDAFRTASKWRDLKNVEASDLEKYRARRAELEARTSAPLPEWALRCRE